MMISTYLIKRIIRNHCFLSHTKYTFFLKKKSSDCTLCQSFRISHCNWIAVLWYKVIFVRSVFFYGRYENIAQMSFPADLNVPWGVSGTLNKTHLGYKRRKKSNSASFTTESPLYALLHFQMVCLKFNRISISRF